ncbi:ImmA/IrrE family metallo-endopeptidase [Anaerovibrio lipolyticus]|uniref:ImmA/IrrE family metallo-endopeptidase n=1 Tax=Anaerovibrio lipolyticus TaxID=82374 RepID=UPI0023F38B44|nr:ImmA/IrrE family metallo-endopeptidase [Anaerovibrio lipolyticus]
MNSLKDYFETKYYDNICNNIINYVDSHIEDLKQKAYKLKQFGEYEIYETSISNIQLYDLSGMDIRCDICVSVTVLVKDGDSHYDNEQEINLTYTLTYKGAVDEGIFEFSDIKPFWDTEKTSRLSQDLVPIIKSAELDKYAETILEEYYPEALNGSEAVNTDILVKRLGLTKIEGVIDEGRNVFGRVYFVDADVPYYDWIEEIDKNIRVKAGTIFVDPKIFFLRNLGAENNTIIHECVHWILHRKAFEFQRLIGNIGINRIECMVDGSTRGAKWDAMNTMEWQANAIAPKIQMPRAAFSRKAEELLSQYSDDIICDAVEKTIVDLSVFFKVSKLAAKIRLVELGYDEAIGAFNYVDGHYVRAHGFKKGALNVNQTFTLSAQDAAIVRFFNQELRQITKDGDYLFVENHYVYNVPLYVQPSGDGHLELTDYARSHMDECCLKFEMKITSDVGKGYHTLCYLNRADPIITFNIEYIGKSDEEENLVAIRKKQCKEAIDIRKQMTDDRKQCIELLLKWRNMDYYTLAIDSGVSQKTIKRTIDSTTSPTLETAAAICIGLNLPPSISFKLLEVLRCPLDPNSERDQWIGEALTVKYNETIDAVREYLAPYGVKI